MVKGREERKLDRDEIISFVGVTWDIQAADTYEWRRLGECGS